MDFNQLRMFCAVAEKGSIARAAELLNRVPSNLTNRLKQLEQDLGTSLFIREKQRLRLSANGYQFLPHAKALVEMAEKTRRLFQAPQPSGLLKLGTLESLGATLLPSVLAKYHQQHPAVTLALEISTSDNLLNLLRQGQLAAIIIDEPEKTTPLQTIPIFKDRLVGISSLNHKPIIDAEQIQNATFFAFDNSCAHRKRLEDWFLLQKLAPPTVMPLNSYHAMIACVAAGAGLALIPESLLRVMPEAKQVQSHTIEADIMAFTVSLLWLEDSHSVNIQALADIVPRCTYSRSDNHPKEEKQ